MELDNVRPDLYIMDREHTGVQDVGNASSRHRHGEPRPCIASNSISQAHGPQFLIDILQLLIPLIVPTQDPIYIFCLRLLSRLLTLHSCLDALPRICHPQPLSPHQPGPGEELAAAVRRRHGGLVAILGQDADHPSRYRCWC